MRISTTFLLFELASIAWAAPRPVNVGQPNAQARSVAFAHGVAPDQNPPILGRGASPIYTREKKSPSPSSTTDDKPEKAEIDVLFSPKGSRGTSLKPEQQSLIKTSVTTLLKAVLPDTKFKFSSTCPRFDEPKVEVPPGGKPIQVVTFKFKDQICGGYCIGFVNTRTGNGKIRTANGREVHRPKKQSPQSPSRHSGSTAPGNPDGPATRPVGRDVRPGASPIGQENANLEKRFWPFAGKPSAASQITNELKENLVTYVNNGGRPASNQEQNMIKQHTTQFLTTTEAKKILPNPKLGQLCPTIKELGDHYKIVSFEFEDKTHGECRGDLNLIDGKGRIEDANGKLIYPAESKGLCVLYALQKMLFNHKL
ncbi:hypothetical protein C8R41DRAFT_47749 [Lentinula lateritia]|uniref:Uncharacterized protein n=1 Tax=Lentinula lateritia TaxID=40482 RepID=A0ABQ8V438_9AGAR|nr:hypothetical protein C8R41DRAFT_47749 [Lentinula lateritia]